MCLVLRTLSDWLVGVCVCVQSESSLLKDKRRSGGLTAASSDMVLVRDVASLMEEAEQR